MHVSSRLLVSVVALYFLASLAHFSHNAQYIAFYPGMPAWLGPEHIYAVWLGITGVGGAAWLLSRFGHPRLALGTLALYGAFGLDALGHYALGLCSQHTLVANLTIACEAGSGALPLVVALVQLTRVRLSATRRVAG